MPVRKIPKSYVAVTGVLASEKIDRLAGFEAPLEKDFLLLQEFDPAVRSYEEQPVHVPYPDIELGPYSYTPDALVHYYAPPGELVQRPSLLAEIKPRRYLKVQWHELKPKFRAAIRFAKARGWRFQSFTEKEIRTPYLYNVKFLMRYLRLRPNEELKATVLDALTRVEEAHPAALLTHITPDRWKQATFVPALWHLVAKREIATDLMAPLTMRSRIWTLQK